MNTPPYKNFQLFPAIKERNLHKYGKEEKEHSCLEKTRAIDLFHTSIRAPALRIVAIADRLRVS